LGTKIKRAAGTEGACRSFSLDNYQKISFFDKVSL